MLGNLSALAITSLISLGSYAYSVTVPKVPQLISPLPLHNTTATPTPTLLPTATPTVPPPTSAPTATPMPTIVISPTPTIIPPSPISTPDDLEIIFERFATEFSVDKELLKKIARCESGFNNNAENGDYHGMFQFATSSWTSTRQAMDLDTNSYLRKNTEEAIKTAAFKISHGGVNAWPSCSK